MALETLDPNKQNQDATVTVQGADASFDNAQAVDQGALNTLAAPTYGSTSAIADWYKTSLGREADTGGLDYWSKQFGETLDPNELTILQSSPEYQNRQFLTGLYDKELGRAYDQPGYDFWMKSLGSGMSKEDVEKSFNLSPEGSLYDIYQQELGRKPDTEGAQFWSSQNLTPEQLRQQIAASEEGRKYDIGAAYESELGRKGTPEEIQNWYDQISKGTPFEDILKSIASSPEGTVYDDYFKYLGRAPDAAGGKYWIEQLQAGIPPQDIARAIALSEEGIKTAASDITPLLEATLGKEFFKTLTPEQINQYAAIYADPSLTKYQNEVPLSFADFDPAYYALNNKDVVAAVGSTPEALYSHYRQYGFNEDRPGNLAQETPAAMSEDDRLLEIYKQIALDPVLGAKLKAENPTMWEKVTPLTERPDEVVRTDRTVYGQYGTVNFDGTKVPILNARVADSLLNYENSGTISDFSHSRGKIVDNLGWSTNSFSGDLSKGANALGITVASDAETGQKSYTGLNEAAALIGIDPAQFKDKQVPLLTTEQRDEFGNVVQAAGQPVYQKDAEGNTIADQNGQPIPAMQTITGESQLYDAISNAAKDIYRYTGDSLTSGRAVEGGAQSFDTVFYKRTGDELIPISKPVSHGGQQNIDVYRPKDYGFGYYAQGPAFVAAAALSFAMADPSLSLATAVGSALLPTAASTAIGATATGIVGSVVLGAATGALSSTAAGMDPGKGALTGAVTGLVASSMKPLLASSSVASATQSIAEASQGVFSQAQVGNIIGATLASTLASAASGANGDQILNSFTTALISSGLSEKAAQLAVAGVKEAFGNDPKTLAKTSAAIKLVTRTASTAALSGKSPEQIQAAVISTLIQNAANIAGAGTTKDTTKDTKGFTKAELEAIEQGSVDAGTVKPGFETASTVTSDQPLPFVPRGEVSVSGFDQKAYDDAINKYGMSPADARAWASSGVGEVEITGVGQNPAEAPNLFVPDPYAVLPDVYDIMAKSQSTAAGGGFTQGGNTFVRGLPIEVIDAIIADTNAPQNVKQEAEKVKQEQIIKKEEEKKKAEKGGGSDSSKTSEATTEAKTSAQEAQQTELIKQAEKASDTAKGDEQAEIVIAVSLVSGLISSGSSSEEAIKKAAKTTGLSEAKIKEALDAKNGTGANVTGPTGPIDTKTSPTGPTGAGTGPTGPTGAGTGPTGPTGAGTGPTGAGTGGTGPTGSGGGGGSGSGTGKLPTLPATIPFIRAAQAAQETSGIYDLTPGLTRARTDYQLAGQFKMATGGAVATQYDPFGLEKSAYGTSDSAGISDPSASPFVGSSLKMPKLKVGMTKRNVEYNLPGYNPKFMAEGGSAEGHNPQFFSEGGLGSLENRYVQGDGNGTSDEVPAMLANGEFVIPADVVAALGNGSNEAGAGVLDQFLQTIREHRQKHDSKDLPPDSKGPLAYLLEAKKRA